jgi:hypothetical protein
MRSMFVWIPSLPHLPSYLQGLGICGICVNSSIVNEGTLVLKKSSTRLSADSLQLDSSSLMQGFSLYFQSQII